MNTSKISFTLTAGLLFMTGVFTGCETTDGGNTRVSSSTYYGSGYYDPWYHGNYHDDPDVIVSPPPAGNPPDQGLRPTHPIAMPPQVSRPPSRPPPSIPSRPRPAPRGGGRR
jgi:hypothetical protein